MESLCSNHYITSAYSLNFEIIYLNRINACISSDLRFVKFRLYVKIVTRVTDFNWVKFTGRSFRTLNAELCLPLALRTVIAPFYPKISLKSSNLTVTLPYKSYSHFSGSQSLGAENHLDSFVPQKETEALQNMEKQGFL